MKNKTLIALVLFVVYFILGLVTIKDYNISWDEPTHFKRGQAYLIYFLTGKTTYEGLPKYNLSKARTDPKYHERSMYQEEGYDAAYHLKNDGDHPPLNDILASFSNYIFYQKLGIMGDVESYHLFGIFISSLLAAYIFIFAYDAFGFWPGIFSSLFLATYPLFWSEGHFNIKDPIETAFFSITIYYIWKSIAKKKEWILLIASLFAGLALGTKLNIIFLPFIIIPWILIICFRNSQIKGFILKKKFILIFLTIPVIAFIIFSVSWPWLLQDVFKNTLSVLGYYRDIGIEGTTIKSMLLFGWKTYPIRWVLYSTQPLLLLFAIAGIILGRKYRDSSGTYYLLLLWLIIPIFRVSIPGTTIYGGIRQIMEYIPGMAILGGLGAGFLIEKIKPIFLRCLLLIMATVVLIFPLYKLHPNENVYLNFLTGGLPGAISSGFPSAGFSFGNAYLQGLSWINQNVEKGAKLSLVQGTVLNIPAYKVRSDIDYSNADWSGIGRNGEYLIDLTYNYELKFYPYAWEYVEKMLDPVYEVKVKGVPILTIWKNDFNHTKENYRKNESIIDSGVKLSTQEKLLTVSLSEKAILSKILIYFKKESGCQMPKVSHIETSIDGNNWYREKDAVPDEQISGIRPINDERLIFFFAAREARFVRFVPENHNSCIMRDPSVVVYELK